MSVDRFIERLARHISEDSDPLGDYHEKWESKTVLSDDTYYQVIGILKKVVEENGCVFDHKKLSVEFIPPGFIIKNVWIDCPDPNKKKELVDSLAQSTGDETIKHTFDDNLRVNLYNAINRLFGERVRQELNLDVTHQFRALQPGSNGEDRSEVLPMITVTTPKVGTEDEGDEFAPDDEMDVASLLGDDPGGPEEDPRGGDLPPPGGVDEQNTQIQLPGFEDEGEPEQEQPEDVLPPRRGEQDDDLISFESIQNIADLTDDFLF